MLGRVVTRCGRPCRQAARPSRQPPASSPAHSRTGDAHPLLRRVSSFLHVTALDRGNASAARRRGALGALRVCSSMTGGKMNIGNALIKAEEGKRLCDLVGDSVSVLEGIGEKRKAALADLGITTVQQLGTWKHHRSLPPRSPRRAEPSPPQHHLHDKLIRSRAFRGTRSAGPNPASAVFILTAIAIAAHDACCSDHQPVQGGCYKYTQCDSRLSGHVQPARDAGGARLRGSG